MRHHLTRPVWQDGLMLCPQHLQLQDIYHEHYLDERLSALVEAPWGVRSMRIEPGGLKTGTLQVTEFRGVMPDGTPLAFDSQSLQCPSARPIGANFPAKSPHLDVHLALPVLREGVANYVNVARSNEASARYVMHERVVVEHTTGVTERRLDVCEARPLLVLGAPEENHCSLKIAELTRDGSGGFALNEGYIPPSLSISASPWLTQQIQELLGMVVTRRREWLEDTRTRDGLRVEFGVQDLTRYLYLQAVSDALPVLKHFCDHLETPPLQLYLTLVQLASRLALFSAAVDPTELPIYKYGDLRSCFGRLFPELRMLLGQTLAQRYVRIPLQARKDGLWVGELRDERMLNCSAYVLAVETDRETQLAAQEIPGKTTLAAWQRINLLIKGGALGARIQPTFSPPQEIPMRPRHVYFVVEHSDPTWQEVLKDRNVALFLRSPYDPSQVKVSLFGVLGRDG